MKVVLIFLALVLSLAAALPLEGSTDGSREDRAKKESAKLRLEHRQTDDDHHSEVVEASEVMISNSGDKSVAQAQPVGLASAGLGGVAVAGPQGIAIVGPGGLALARPIAVAIAGPGADNPLIFLKPEEEAPPAEEGGQQGGEPEVEEEDPQPTFYSPTYLFYYPLFNRFPVH